MAENHVPPSAASGFSRCPHGDAPAAISLQVQPFGRPVVIGYVGGAFCRELEEAGEDAMVELARERFLGIFGRGLAPRIVEGAAVRWGRDPHVLGGYSCARPGAADQREVLCRPIDDKLFFAGEACSREFYASTHGAYLSGLRAAQQVATALG